MFRSGSRVSGARVGGVRIPALALTAIFLLATAAPSQESPAASSGSVEDVMLAFLGVEKDDLHIGSIPEEVERFVFVPADARVLGTLVREHGVGVLAESAMDFAAVSTWLERAYESEGWRSMDFGGQRGGFNPGPSERPSQFCREDQMIHVSVEPSESGSRLHYHHSEMRRMGTSCEDLERHGRDRGLSFEFPALSAPEGAEQRYGGGRCSGMGQESIGTGLEADMQAVEVLDHYAAQLSEAGWLPVASCWDGPVAVHAWRIESEADEPRSGLLLVEEQGERLAVQLSVSSGLER